MPQDGFVTQERKSEGKDREDRCLFTNAAMTEPPSANERATFADGGSFVIRQVSCWERDRWKVRWTPFLTLLVEKFGRDSGVSGKGDVQLGTVFSEVKSLQGGGV